MSGGQSDVLADALAAIETWRTARPWARLRVPSAKRAVSVAPRQVYLTTFFETRRVEYAFIAASTCPANPDPRPDPWTLSMDHSRDAKAHDRITLPLKGQLFLVCEICHGSGDARCPKCDGAGKVHDFENREVGCPECSRRGWIACPVCAESGGVFARPTAISEIHCSERMQVDEASELPLDALLELMDEEREGETVYLHESDRIVDLPRQGYRDTASDTALREIVIALGNTPDIPPGSRVLRQRLEVRAVPAWKVTLDDDRDVFVYGVPPRVTPERHLLSTAGKLARLFVTHD